MTTVTTVTTERQLVFDVDADFGLPDLVTLSPAIDHILERDQVALRSRYFDTADLDLLQSRVTLRHRSGDVDAGWQLKLPNGETRTEIAVAEPDTITIPESLGEVVTRLAHGKALVPILDLRILRDLRRLVGADGATLLTISDDQVESASVSGAPALLRWREVEVEAGPGADASLLAEAADRISAAGGTPSNAWSKVVRAFARLDVVSPRLPETAGTFVTNFLAEQHTALLRGAMILSSGTHSTHEMRVACRRIRSALRVFGAVYEPVQTQQLDKELQWLAWVLGRARDGEVSARRLRRAVAALPPDVVFGGPAAVMAHFDAERDRRTAAAVAVLDDPRYRAVLDELERFLAEPPYTAEAGRDPRTLVPRVDEALHLVERRQAKLHSASADAAAVHRLRKAVKRARYAVELAAPLLEPKRAKRELRRLSQAQARLGDQHDATLAALLTFELASTAPGELGTGFTFGLLYAAEHGVAEHGVAEHSAAAARRG